jgi:23S rRNA (cytosine1962-C5)-methyltransferase
MKARRYQLRKDAVAIIERGHPWIFREQMSSAANVLTDGELLRLVDGQNQVVGYGLYESEGAIAIRMLRRGPDHPDAAWLRATLDAALARRADLARDTTGIRLVAGESDGIAAVVVDQFGDTAVVSSYSQGADVLARYVAHALRAPNVVLRPARRRRGPPQGPRTLRGTPPELARFTEYGIEFVVDFQGGHKTGTYLDLRNLRRYLRTHTPAGARVLNLFSYTGMLGRVAEIAGASHVVHVDQSARALELAAAHHIGDADKHTFVTADVFEWLPSGPAGFETFDVVIVDPPAMTSKKTQVPGVLAAYRKLYATAQQYVAPGGMLVAACCTSRIERAQFKQVVTTTLGAAFQLTDDLPPEVDHPVGFPQADYLKVLVFRRSRDQFGSPSV